jgi:hypothetical protein
MSASGNPLSSLLTGLEAWAESVKEKIIAVADAFLPTVVNDIEVALEDIAAIAGNAVLAQATAVLSGTEKFGNAVADVVQTVETQGKTVAIQTAQMAVQQAFIVVKTVAAANTPKP